MPPSSTSSSEPRTYGLDGFRFPVAGVLCVVILLAAEGSLRAARGAGAGWALRATSPSTPQVLEGRIWGQCRNLPWLHQPGGKAIIETTEGVRVEFSANTEGFHDVEHRDPPREGGRRILVLGDSHAAHVFTPAGLLWPRRLEEILSARGGDAEVFNMAVGGTSTAEQYSILQVHGPRVRPRAVVVQVTGNDIRETSVHPVAVAFHEGTRLLYSRPESLAALRRKVDLESALVARRLSRWSMLIRALHHSRGFVVSYSRMSEAADLEPGESGAARRRTVAYLQAIERISEEGGSRLCVIWDRGGVWGRKELALDLEWVSEHFRPSSRTLVLDTHDGFDKRVRDERLLLDDGDHLIPEGHAAMARWVAERLEGWLDE